MLRAPLFIPGNRASMLAKVPTLAADALVLDLEDSVPLGEKESARSLVRTTLLAHGRGAVPLYVRVNAVASGLTEADLSAVAVQGLAAVVLPLIERHCTRCTETGTTRQSRYSSNTFQTRYIAP